MLELRDLHKRFGDVVALDGCSFSVEPGMLVGFLGPNGAGKTTAMRTIFDLVRPDRGEVTWNGAPIDYETRLGFGYMPEERGLYPRMRIRQQVTYFAALHGMGRADAEAAATRWLTDLGLGDRLESKLEVLSHGNQQRVQLATAMTHDPELLVLDEPFAGLDPIGVEAMAGILSERAAAGTVVVFSSHQLDLVEDLCERVVIIDGGSVVLEGTVSGLRSGSPRRYIDASVASDAEWWLPLPGVVVVAADGEHVRLAVDRNVDVGAAFRLAETAGTVRHFSFEPPNLSEVFREAVSPG
ncbi:MAG: ATP-binding cassette domain-containing protein [Actinobacteria bacterium]|nr:MAG: ATP-binding cassette domain-containing protein [Actinomycetota bacterium]